jgi:hypothetical protein
LHNDDFSGSGILPTVILHISWKVGILTFYSLA